jgi:hypothetical protein
MGVPIYRTRGISEPLDGRTWRASALMPEKRHSKEEGRRSGNRPLRPGRRQHAAHDSRIRSKMIAEVPSAGLSSDSTSELVAQQVSGSSAFFGPGAS